MDRAILYSHITICGGVPYSDQVYIINNVQMPDESIRYLLLQHAADNSGLLREDWITLAKAAKYNDGSTINGAIVESWLAEKEKLSAVELKTFLDNVAFTDGTKSTILLSELGDIIIAEF